MNKKYRWFVRTDDVPFGYVDGKMIKYARTDASGNNLHFIDTSKKSHKAQGNYKNADYYVKANIWKCIDDPRKKKPKSNIFVAQLEISKKYVDRYGNLKNNVDADCIFSEEAVEKLKKKYAFIKINMIPVKIVEIT